MTFCLGMRVRDGLVGIADTRITFGTECITAQKLSTYEGVGWSMFVMTSGLRSVRDKAITYYDEAIRELDEVPANRLFKLVNLFAEQIRRVAREDKQALEDSGLRFNSHALIGGQLPEDTEPRLYLIYPEGNWVEVGKGTPYHIIGSSGYGKPILDRTLKYDDSLRFAVKVGVLAFDSTRISAADVDFPIDVVIYRKDSFQLVSQRFDKADLIDTSEHWQEKMRNSVSELELAIVDPLLARLPSVGNVAQSLPGSVP